MTSADTTREFLSRVVPWPGSVAEPGWVNIHWRSPLKDHPDRSFWGGRPVKTIDDFLWWINWTKGKPNVKDVYFCTSLQAQAGKNTKGNPKVMRSKELALSLKALWLDVDVKEEPKGYPTLEAALKAVGQFVKDAALPPPSALVATGGGLHVYWISDKELLPREWQPYAEGLKALAIKLGLRCDAGLTTDSARILRVPGTFNHKQLPLRPVRILGLRAREFDYDFRNALSHIAIAGAAPATGTYASPLAGSGPSSAFAALAPETLSQGIERQEYPPLEWQAVAKGCAFIGKALKTEGKDYSQPMWNLTTLAATFMENGHALAHKMGKAHPGYSVESTEALWERKNRERKDRGLGWPSCAAVQASGCADCALCPHFSKGKSPLSLAKPVQKTEPQGEVSLVSDNLEGDLQLPRGYALDSSGRICTLIEQKGKNGDAGEAIMLPLFYSRLSNPQVYNPPAISFTTTLDKGRSQRVYIELSKLINGTKMWEVLQTQGVVPAPRQRHLAEDFLMSWLSRLQDAKRAQNTVPFGWWYDEEDGQCKGFVYGGILMKSDGTESPCATGDTAIRSLYKPTGSLQPWLDAFKLVADQKRPELEAIIAAAFAAPLLRSGAENSCVLSIYGGSGVGKSTALKVGMSVWGNPKRAKETTLSTPKSVINKMGEIVNLPLYWDEITEVSTQKAVFKVFFTGTEGVEGSRLTSDVRQRDRGSWQTMLITCSNLSLVDYVARHQTTTDAGIYRVFEYVTHTHDPNGPGVRTSTEASRITQELERNFGIMGMKYAKMLADNPVGIDEMTREVIEQFAKEVEQMQPERYWVVTCGTLIAGATLANLLGATFDVPALRKFLVTQYYENRKRCLSEATEGGSVFNTEAILTGWLRENVHTALFTDTYPQGRGKPTKPVVHFSPRLDNGKGITVQWSINDKVLRFSRDKFNDYLALKEISPAHVYRGLRAHFGMTAEKSNLGAGTPWAVGRENVVTIPVQDGTWLAELLYAHKAPPQEPVAT